MHDPSSILLPANVTLLRGSVFDSRLETILVTVNTVGAMGRGVALEAKKLYPVVYKRYRRDLANGRLTSRSLVLYRGTPDGRNILLFPTKEEWWKKSDIGMIEDNLVILRDNYRGLGISSLAMTMLGCGNGWLKESDVLPLMARLLPIDIPIEIWKK